MTDRVHRGPVPTPMDELLLRRRRIDGDHWLWTGVVQNAGYGQVSGGRLVHRAAWETWRGPIPEGYDIHHECGERLCFNPAHLALAERVEHRRAHRVAPYAETCGKGHRWEEHGTRKKDGTRYCRACKREADRARRLARGM